MLPQYYVGREGDMCKCGRRLTIVHCPSCGSFRVVKLKRPEFINGQEIYYYTCHKCGMRFEEREQKQYCEAPKYETKLQQVAAELVRTKNAVEEGHPLTKKEQKLAPVVVPLASKEAAWRRQWMEDKLNNKTSISCNEYVARMREMEKEGQETSSK